MALNHLGTMALNHLGTMALKSDLNSAKVISNSRAQHRKDVLDLGGLRQALVGAHPGLTERS